MSNLFDWCFLIKTLGPSKAYMYFFTPRSPYNYTVWQCNHCRLNPSLNLRFMQVIFSSRKFASILDALAREILWKKVGAASWIQSPKRSWSTPSQPLNDTITIILSIDHWFDAYRKRRSGIKRSRLRRRSSDSKSRILSASHTMC